MPMQLRHLEWSDQDLLRVRVMSLPASGLIRAEVINAEGETTTSYQCHSHDRESVYRLAKRIQPLIHDHIGTSSMVHEIFNQIERLMPR